MRILEGENADTIPITLESPHITLFDFNELVQSSLSLRALPPESIITNQPDNFFYRYFREVAVILITFLILLVLIILLYINIHERKQSEKALAKLNYSLNNRVIQRTRDLEELNLSLQDTLEKLQETQNELIRKERLAALGSLVSGIAHEINTPLGVSITTSSFMDDLIQNLKNHFDEDSLTREGMEDFIVRLGDGSRLLDRNLKKKTANLIDSFKNLSFDETGGECLSFELKEYIEEIIRTHTMQFYNSRIDIQLKGDEINLFSYPGSFYHIINNLLVNSLSHGFTSHQEDKTITISLSRLEGKTGMLEYKDNGIGIPSQIIEHMFEPFTTTSRTEGKTGLGLFIVFKTVHEKLGGAIDYVPLKGNKGSEGSCFRIYFPIDHGIDNC